MEEPGERRPDHPRAEKSNGQTPDGKHVGVRCEDGYPCIGTYEKAASLNPPRARTDTFRTTGSAGSTPRCSRITTTCSSDVFCSSPYMRCRDGGSHCDADG